jgi:hypothetical protein
LKFDRPGLIDGEPMSDEITPDRVMTIAAGAGIQLDTTTAERVARAVNPSAKRFSAERIRLPLEVEPATFVVVARNELGR